MVFECVKDPIADAHLPEVHGLPLRVRHAEFPDRDWSIFYIRQCPPGEGPIVRLLVRIQNLFANRRPGRRPQVSPSGHFVTVTKTVNCYHVNLSRA